MRTEHKQIQSDNGITHYWIMRNTNKAAKCIVLTHGLTADHSMFEKQVEYFQENCSVIKIRHIFQMGTTPCRLIWK
mgnify:CR=1 FL=1